MKIVLGLVLGVVILVPFIGVSAEDGSGDSGYYVFIGADLRAEYKSTYGDVVAADRKGVYIQTHKGEKRVKYTADCSFAPRVGVSTSVIELTDQKFTFDYMRQGRLEAQAISEMFRTEAETETEITRMGGDAIMESTGAMTAEMRERITDLQDRQDAMSSSIRTDIEDGNYERDDVSDYIHTEFTLKPPQDVENAYCAMIVRYQREDRENIDGMRAAVMVRMKRVGNLLAGTPNKVKFGYSLPEGVVTKEGIELHLFSGDGEPLATSFSKGLHMLSNDELEKFRARGGDDS